MILVKSHRLFIKSPLSCHTLTDLSPQLMACMVRSYQTDSQRGGHLGNQTVVRFEISVVLVSSV